MMSDNSISNSIGKLSEYIEIMLADIAKKKAEAYILSDSVSFYDYLCGFESGLECVREIMAQTEKVEKSEQE
jgi:hypothetical protein